MLRHLLRGQVADSTLGTVGNGTYWGLVCLALIVGGYLTHRRLVELGNDRRQVARLAIFCAVTATPLGIVSSQAVKMFYQPRETWSLALWLEETTTLGTHTYHAAMVLPMVAWFVYIKRSGLDFWQVADVIMLNFPLGHAIGRAGCLVAGCCYGGPVHWQVLGLHYDYKNPVPLYAIVGNTLLHLGLLRLFHRVYFGSRPRLPGGLVVASYFGAYGAMRFGLELIRTEPVVAYGLTQAQLTMCLFMALSGLLFLRVRSRRDADADCTIAA